LKENQTMIYVTDEISIAQEELEEKFIRSSGPGGQNVNKLATAVQLRFAAGASPNLPHRVRVRLLQLAGTRATKEGVVLIEADSHRTRERNRAEAKERLVALIKAAAAVPKYRRKTRPTKASKVRRVEAKKRRSTIKSARGRVRSDD
jgi:ribosome-associated protein